MVKNKISQAVLEINLGKISKNYKFLKEKTANKVRCSAVVKADAYGLGIKYIAPILSDAGCREFYVAHASEAIELRKILEDKDIKIYVLHGIYASDCQEIIKNNIIPVLNSLEDIELWRDFAKKACNRVSVNIHIDTGMNRLGLSPKDMSHLTDNSHILDLFSIEYIMSHLACSDEVNNIKNKEQLLKFKETTKYMEKYSKSFANSGGIFLGENYHFNQTRPGCAIYGINPKSGFKNPMQGVVSLKAPILQIREVTKGETIGYGASYLLKKATKLAIISVGYADGIFRSFAEGIIYIKGYKCSILGRVSMDIIIVDISEVKELLEQGDWAEIIGENQTLDEIAPQMKTIGYEVLTSLGNRYKRVYSQKE